MTGPRIEGFAIVSADGMIADAQGRMPDSLLVKADQQFFHGGLDNAAAVVHGRHSNEGGPNAERRPRLVVTRKIKTLAPDPNHPNSFLWNPAGVTLDEAWQTLGVPDGDGMLAVIGGTEVFGMFLPRYDAFHLSRAANARLPGGRPVFPGVPEQTPEQLLARHGLKSGPRRNLDAAAGVSVVTWERR